VPSMTLHCRKHDAETGILKLLVAEVFLRFTDARFMLLQAIFDSVEANSRRNYASRKPFPELRRPAPRRTVARCPTILRLLSDRVAPGCLIAGLVSTLEPADLPGRSPARLDQKADRLGAAMERSRPAGKCHRHGVRNTVCSVLRYMDAVF
jgi:hypothetical protein